MGTSHPKTGPVIVRKVPHSWRSALHKSWWLKEKRYAARSSLKSKNTGISTLSKAKHGTVSCLLWWAEWIHAGTKQSDNRLRNTRVWGERFGSINFRGTFVGNLSLEPLRCMEKLGLGVWMTVSSVVSHVWCLGFFFFFLWHSGQKCASLKMKRRMILLVTHLYYSRPL